ncbi:MAG: ribosome assembly RNA-binding protein YhbY [Gammaproteobacteria bacterium]
MNSADKKKHRAQAHALKPVVMIGQAGLTPAVMAEIESALDSHELIKVRIRADDREFRKRIGTEICAATSAELIQTIGQILVIYRRNPDQ